MMTTYEWLKSIGATESLREIAAKVGISHPTLSRQINDGRFLMDTLIRLARAYDTSPTKALVNFGYLTDEEAGLDGVEAALRVATEDQLVMEIARRLEAPVVQSLFDRPVSEAFEAAGNVHQFRPRNVSPAGHDEGMREVASRDFDVNPDQDDHGWDA